MTRILWAIVWFSLFAWLAIVASIWATWDLSAMTHHSSSPDIVEQLIENLIQTSYEYEKAEGSDAKYMRGEFGRARHAVREHIAQLQYEAGMYRSLYEAAIEKCAKIAENNGWEATAAQIRDLAMPSPQSESGK